MGDGAREAVMDRISSLGTNLLLVRPGAVSRAGKGGGISTLIPEDAQAIANLPNVLAAVPEIGGGVTVRYGNADYQTSATATSETFPVGRNWHLSRVSKRPQCMSALPRPTLSVDRVGCAPIHS